MTFRISLIVTLVFLTLSVSAEAQVPGVDQVYPFTIEGASIVIIKPVDRGSNGIVKISSEECNVCSQRFVITANTKIMIANSGLEASSVELASHAHKLASVHISGPNTISGFSFQK